MCKEGSGDHLSSQYNRDTVLETPLLFLLPTKAQELPLLMEIEQHPENRPELFVSTLEEHEFHRTDENFRLFSIYDKVDEKPSEMIGYAMVQLDFHSQTFLLRRFAFLKKDRGYGRQTLIALIKHCFDDLGLNRFYLDVYPHNKRAIHLYEGVGLIWEGTLRENYCYEGKFLDQRLYSMLRREYEKQNW
ncbi:MAG TPA: GNAT family N-acetyltransferase [Tissierellia bacterium]|nr:GNAT family N-acetyltransferase [Tissierellia bacterium]